MRITGTIRANPAREYPNHLRAGIHFDRDAARPFVVDPDAVKITDRPGEPLVLTPAIYADLREVNGHALVIELASAPDPAQAQRIAELERDLAEATREIADLRAEIIATRSRQEERITGMQAMHEGEIAKARGEIDAQRGTIIELQAQLQARPARGGPRG